MATQFPAMKLLVILLAFVVFGVIAVNPTGLFAASADASVILTATQNTYEGSPTTFTLQFADRNPSDLSRYDVYNPYEIIWSWGDGLTDTDTIIPDSTSFQTTQIKQHTYRQDKVYRISVRVHDSTTGADVFAYALAKVLNAPPEIVSLEANYVQGGQWQFVGNYMDPGVLDTHLYMFDFGDGSATSWTRAPTVNGAGRVVVSHTYSEEGAGDWTQNPCADTTNELKYPVKLTIFSVQDSNRAYASTTIEVAVSIPPPSYEERLAWVRNQATGLALETKHQKEIVESLNRALLDASTGPGLPVQEPDSPQHNYIKSFDRVRKAVHHVQKANEVVGAGYLCALNYAVRDKTKERLDLAIQQVGPENKEVAKAQQKYDEGLELLLAGKFNEAINKLKESLAKATKAISKDVLFSYSDELDFSVGDVEGLLGVDVRADKELNKIIDTITKAKALADKDKFQEATEHVKQAVDDLQKVQQRFGIDTTQMTTDMVLDIELAASLKLSEAQQIIVGPERSSVKSAQALSEGSALREAGDYRRAIDKFQEAYREAAKAIKEGGKPATT